MQIRPGTRALVTGASRGIGRALARALAERGATVGLAARSTEALERLAFELPGEHMALTCDVADAGSVAAAVERFVAATGGLELLVANAGVAHYERVGAQPLAHVEAMTAVNWLGTVHVVAAALAHLLAADRGHVVVVSSAAGLRAFPGAAVYGATKAAQRLYADALRHELAGSRVSVTTVVASEVRTALHDHERERMPGWHRGGARAVAPEALAERIVRAVERDRRALHHRPAVRAMGALQGLSPALTDEILRRLRGPAAAPRRR